MRAWWRAGARCPGARSTPVGTRVEVSTRSGNTRTPDEAWSDWSPAYARANGSTITSPKARYLQWRAVLTGKMRHADADVGHRRVSAAQRAAGRRLHHRAPARRRVPEAVLDRRDRDRGLRGRQPVERRMSSSNPGGSGAPPGSRRSAAGPIRRVCRPSCGRPRMTTAMSSPSTCSTGARARRRGSCSRVVSRFHSGVGHRPRRRTVRTCSRSWRRTPSRIPPTPHCVASARAPASTSTTRRR